MLCSFFILSWYSSTVNDCALITETWYTKKHQDTLVGIPNDTLFRRDRLRGKGGGVCAYVRSSISCSVFVPGVGAQSRVNDVEILWLDCTLHDCHYFVACCYHPPKPKYNYSVLLMFCLVILITLIVCIVMLSL